MDFQHIEATFGKLEHRSLSFSKGLNIIEAPNESGKSTLLAFLRVMLYGFPPRERGAMADKNRYAPWSLSPMRGTLALTCQKGDITLQRDTARANSPMGRFSAVYTGSGEAVAGLTAADLTTWESVGALLCNAVRNPYCLFLVLSSVWNAVNDPTTKGVADSERARSYETPSW